MDIATIIGLIGAMVMISLSITAPAMFIDMPSVYIVIGGSLFTVLVRSSLSEFVSALSVAGKTFKNKLDKPEALITKLVELATIARKDGMIALPEGPGWGVEINPDWLSRATYQVSEVK